MPPPPGPIDFNELIAQDLARLEADHCRRSRRVITPLSPTRVRIEGIDGDLLNFASNNYLGLTHHPRVVEAARTATQSHGAGSGAAPLISGYSELHRSAERSLADWKGTEDSLLFPSGYQANHAAVQTLAALGEQGGRVVRFLVDKLVHASLIDAVRGVVGAGGASSMRVFPHNHVAKLERLLTEAPPGQLEVVVTESVFSMDGDAADLPALVALKHRHPLVLLLDEAHGSGVYGRDGAGYAAELNVREHVDVSVVTLSKALGGIGGAVCGSRRFCDAVVNHGRGYLFSTSVPASACAGAAAAVEVMREEPWRQQRVRQMARHVRRRACEVGFDVPGVGQANSPEDSPIIPLIFGSEESALSASAELLSRGLLVPAIRPPTVARGTSRLRVTVCCDHSDEDVERLVEAVGGLR